MPGHRWLRETCTPARNPKENSMKKIFAALAVLGIVLGTATLITPAYAAYYSFEGSHNQGDNQGNNS
jgi:ABC-type lipoprotein release transport system permease subunit